MSNAATAWDLGLPNVDDPGLARMRGETIVSFGWTGWERGTQAWHQILRRLAYRNRVIYVPPALERTEVFGSRFHPDRGRSGLRHLQDHLYVYRFPRFLPNFYRPPALVRSIEAARIIGLRRAIRSLAERSPILYMVHPRFRAYAGQLGEKKVVYHLLDDYRGYLGANREKLLLEEKALLEMTDLVLCASPGLAGRMGGNGADVRFLPNGVDYDLFSQAAEETLPTPPELAGIPGPRAGYLGQIGNNLDFRLLLDLAKALPEVSFCFAGPVLIVGREERPVFDEWSSRPNVFLLGNKLLDDLPSFVGAFDVGLLPYTQSEWSRHRYPLKLHEYFAAGIPVVSIPLVPVREFDDLLQFATEPATWAEAIREAIDERDPEKRRARREAAGRHAWDRIVYRIEQLLGDENGRGGGTER